MRNQVLAGLVLIALCGNAALAQRSGGRDGITRESERLVTDAETLAADAYGFFAGYNGVIQVNEQAVLFKAEAFAASARLFSRLSRDSGWSQDGQNIRTNINSAFDLLRASFDELESVVTSTERDQQWGRRNRPLPSRTLRNIREDLRYITDEFARWPSLSNPIYLAAKNKFVRGEGQNAVYLIRENPPDSGKFEKMGLSMEGMFAYYQKEYLREDPRRPERNHFGYAWDNQVVIPEHVETLKRLPDSRDSYPGYSEGDWLAMGDSRRFSDVSREHGGVYRVKMEGDRKVLVGASSPEDVFNQMRQQGMALRNVNDIWSRIYHVPKDVLQDYGIIPR